MMLSREEAIKATASTMEVIKTDMYYICRADGDSARFTTEFIENQKRRYEQAGINFDIKEFMAGILYNRLLNE